MRSKLTYGHIFKASLSMLLMLVFICSKADNTQTLTNLTLQTITSGAGDAASSIAYNPIKNEYFVVYSDFDASCASNQELRGQIINAGTGQKSGSVVNLTTSDLPCVTRTISNPKIAFNQQRNEYLIVYKLSTSLGARINYLSVNATNFQVGAPITLDEDEIADPFKNWTIDLNNAINIYTVAYHKENALSESSLTLKFIDGITKGLKGYTVNIDKDNFPAENKGVFSSQLQPINNNLLVSFETKLTAGSEINGIFINPQSGISVGSIFQISPDGSPSQNYLNPAIAFNSVKNEVLVVYEEARAIGANYALNYKIHGQKISATNGSLLSPINAVLTTLPSTPYTEDSKLPSVCFSEMSQEYLISFYGIRYAAGSDLYNIYSQRVNESDLAPITATSQLVKNMAGSQVVQNNYLKRLSSSLNSINNQFLISWNSQSGNNVEAQVWRYDNNLPKNLAVAGTSKNENIPIGTTFTTLSASDPDPEDTNLIFSFVSGVGGEDNSYFTISGNAIKVAKNLNYEESPTRKIKVKATDTHGKSTELSVVLNINNINEKPTNLALSGTLSVAENAPAGTFTSTISVQDEDIGDTHTYSLVAGDSSDNNNNFSIEPGTKVLKLIKELNYEATPKQFVRIMATDNGGRTTAKGFVIQVIDVNEPPEDVVLSSNTFPENDIATMATVDVIDPDSSSNYVVGWTAGSGDDDNALFNLQDNKLRPITALNFEAKSNYTVRLKAFDGTYTTSKSFTISVADENDAPDSIRLSEVRIEAEQIAEPIVGQLITYDQDASDTHIYQLIEGSTHFYIKGTELRILDPLPYDSSVPANNFYSIVVRSTDSQGESKEETIRIEVVLVKDEIDPTISDFKADEKFIAKTASQLDITVDVEDNEKLEASYFFYRPIRSYEDFVDGSTLIETDIVSNKFHRLKASLNTSILDEMGIEYFFVAKDAAGRMDTTTIGYTYWSYAAKSFGATSGPYNGTLQSYKIITNPYGLESSKIAKIFAEYPSSGNNSWRLFSFENQQTKEIGSVSSGESMAQGKGYWFNKTEELVQPIEFDFAETPENNKENPFTFQLKQGWNLIGNPYPFELNWDDVLLYNNLPIDGMELSTYDRGYKTQTHALKEFEGGFVFADKAGELIFPIQKNVGSGNRIAHEKESGAGWQVKLSLDNGIIKNEMSGIGMNSNAHESYDRYDRPLLPRFINHLDIAFNHPEHFAKAFSKDVVAIQENYIWEFVASNNFESNKVTLSWDAHDITQSPNRLILYDILNDKIIDMKVTTKYAITLNEQAPFKALYGDEAFINDALAHIKTEALTPYPNPFNQLVSFPINLPYSTNKYNVECGIFNLMGEKVFERKIENIESGVFNLDWDEAQTETINQGIYIYSIKVTNGFLINNFHGRVLKN